MEAAAERAALAVAAGAMASAAAVAAKVRQGHAAFARRREIRRCVDNEDWGRLQAYASALGLRYAHIDQMYSLFRPMCSSNHLYSETRSYPTMNIRELQKLMTARAFVITKSMLPILFALDQYEEIESDPARINFLHFVVVLCDLCRLRDFELIRFVVQLHDDRELLPGTLLDRNVLRRIQRSLHGNSADMSIRMLVRNVPWDDTDRVRFDTLTRYLLLHLPFVQPFFTLQKFVRRKVLGARFWGPVLARKLSRAAQAELDALEIFPQYPRPHELTTKQMWQRTARFMMLDRVFAPHRLCDPFGECDDLALAAIMLAERDNETDMTCMACAHTGLVLCADCRDTAMYGLQEDLGYQLAATVERLARVNMPLQPQEEPERWLPLLDRDSDRVFFVHRDTCESVWGVPDDFRRHWVETPEEVYDAIADANHW